jgi:hypothetical protein
MSYSNNQNKKTNLFCKVCYNKGDVKLSRTHNTCDDKGNNCCPKLAAFTCTYCDASGHTQKFCTKKKRDQDRETRQDLYLKTTLQKHKEGLANEKENVSGKSATKANVKVVGSFAALLDESDGESDREDEKVQKQEKKPVQVLQKASAARAAFARAWERSNRKVGASRCWADAEDSDDEEEEEQKPAKMSTARAALLGLWEPPKKSTIWKDVQDEELHVWAGARKRYGFEAVDKDERERLARKNK